MLLLIHTITTVQNGGRQHGHAVTNGKYNRYNHVEGIPGSQIAVLPVYFKLWPKLLNRLKKSF